MVAEGHSTVVEGWKLFKEAVEETGPGDLPQLLCQLKGKTMLTETIPSPLPASPMEVGEKAPMPPPFTSKKRAGV